MISNRMFIEVGVIVSSILLAFAIDAAWDARRSSLLERNIVASIRSEMDVNLIEINRTIGDLEDVQAATKLLLSLTPAELYLLNPDDFRILTELFSTRTYAPASGSISDASLNQIENLEIRNRLGVWMGFTSDLVEDSLYLRTGLIEVRSAASTGGALLAGSAQEGLIGENIPGGVPKWGEVFEKLRQDEKFINAALLQNMQTTVSLLKAYKLRDYTESLINMLKAI